MTIEIFTSEFEDYPETTPRKIKLKFNPKKYKSAPGAAKAFYKALVKFSKECGDYPDPEKYISLWNPEEAEYRGYGKTWRVSWEDGPYGWGIGASMVICNSDANWYTEPHYSFDLGFIS